jgi:hypothetical protein
MNVEGTYHFKLYTVSGVCVLHKKSAQPIETIPTHQLDAGVYVLQLTINNKHYNCKIHI